MPLTLSMKAGIRGSFTSALDLGQVEYPVDVQAALALANGTGADQADLIWTDSRTLAASGTENLDCAGVLANAFGVTFTAARLKGVLVRASASNTNDVQLTRPATNGVPVFMAAGDGVAIKPGGVVFIGARDAVGYPVTAGTGDLLTVTNSAGGSSVSYDVVLVGCSA